MSTFRTVVLGFVWVSAGLTLTVIVGALVESVRVDVARRRAGLRQSARSACHRRAGVAPTSISPTPFAGASSGRCLVLLHGQAPASRDDLAERRARKANAR